MTPMEIKMRPSRYQVSRMISFKTGLEIWRIRLVNLFLKSMGMAVRSSRMRLSRWEMAQASMGSSWMGRRGQSKWWKHKMLNWDRIERARIGRGLLMIMLGRGFTREVCKRIIFARWQTMKKGSSLRTKRWKNWHSSPNWSQPNTSKTAATTTSKNMARQLKTAGNPAET